MCLSNSVRLHTRCSPLPLQFSIPPDSSASASRMCDVHLRVPYSIQPARQRSNTKYNLARRLGETHVNTMYARDLFTAVFHACWRMEDNGRPSYHGHDYWATYFVLLCFEMQQIKRATRKIFAIELQPWTAGDWGRPLKLRREGGGCSPRNQYRQ